MAEIIERIAVDVEDMPGWMREAFLSGRVFHTCVKKVAELEQQLEKYGRHLPSCRKVYVIVKELEGGSSANKVYHFMEHEDVECTCGRTKALKGGE